MRTNKNFILRGIADEYMLVPINEAAQEFNGILHFTETASFIWKMVDQCETITDIVKKVIEEYEVDEETAKKDVFGFLWEFYIRGFVLDIPELESIKQELESKAAVK